MLSLLLFSAFAFGETDKVVFAHQNGWAYTPMYVMEKQGLVEKFAAKAGIKLSAQYQNLGSNGTIRDAIIAGDVQFGVVGPPTLLTMYDKTHDTRVVANFVSLPMLLVTNNSQVKRVCDFLKFPGKIGLPTIKSSVQAVTLQMAAKKECGAFDALDRLTVSLTHPDAMAALMSGNEVSAHFSSPPFQQLELANGGGGKRHQVLNSYDVLGGRASFVLLVGSQKWADANPKALAVVGDAVDEAVRFTGAHPKEAAEIYVKAEKSKETAAEVAAQMSSKEVSFDTAPDRIEVYGNFMHEIGTIKAKTTWKELSLPRLHSRKGS
jgi:NitT/TauT family transport system substrate-binding protein